MRSIRIVTHCYAKRLPQYAAFLRYQLSSLASAPIPTTIAVCYVPGDEKTEEVLDWFDNLLERNLLEEDLKLSLLRVPLEERVIYPRCHGRHLAAITATEDVVWFTDVDYLFLGDCLPTVVQAPELWDEHNSMVYVRRVQINTTHTLGDELALRSYSGLALLTEEDLRDQFVQKVYRQAIGGVQIVRGAFAREHGYLPGMPTRKSGTPFDRGSRDDRMYRKACYKHGSIVPIEAPGVYRLRHSQTTRRLGRVPSIEGNPS